MNRGASLHSHPIAPRACVNGGSRARSGRYLLRPDSKVPTARFILVTLICASPIILVADGLIMQGLVAWIVASALAIIAQSLHPGEAKFLVSLILAPIAVAAVPALEMLIQLLPLRVFAHPIWTSAEQALGYPVAGAISVDLGQSVIALGKYLSMAAVALLSAAVAVDRVRAEWLLFALTAAGATIGLGILAQHVFYPGRRIRRTPASASHRLRGNGSNFCQRGLDPRDRAIRDPPLGSAAISTYFAADRRGKHRRAGDLRCGVDPRRDVLDFVRVRMRSGGFRVRVDHPSLRARTMELRGDSGVGLWRCPSRC